jgi:elongation factor Ts
MAAITAQAVAQLREQTGAGMMQCKQALTEADGDIEQAKVILRKKLGDKAMSRGAERTASEGLVMAQVSDNDRIGALVELNCETDFVARNEDFKALARKLVEKILSYPAGTVPTSQEAFLSDTMEGGMTVEQTINDAAGPIGEKVALGRWKRFGAPEGNLVSAYVHNPGGSGSEGGKIGVLVELTGADAAKLEELGRAVALQIASLNPQYLNESDVPAEVIAQERDIARAQATNDPKMAGKPEQVIESMVSGRIRKRLEEMVLLNQPYIREDKKTVGAFVKETPGASIVRFVRFKVGENTPKAQEA